MRILTVGSGGREHALCWKLAQEAEVICAPGNPGILQDVECISIKAANHDDIANLAQSRSVDLVVIGPEDPLVDGIADHLRAKGLVVYGPNAAGALLEGSKAFSKDLMQSAGVPTAAFRSFNNASLAAEYAKARFEDGRQLAIKASGNALGKGVIVTGTVDEALDAIERMMVAREFGEAGEVIVIEDRLFGPEFSVVTIAGDENFISLPIAQDHKGVYDGNTGPNTGGMGTYSPVNWVSDSLIETVNERVVAPMLAELKRRGITYRGTLFSGLMMDLDLPHCLEYNVRFGDPETQAQMFRLGHGFADALLAAASGKWIEAPEVKDNAAVSVVIASEGYPMHPRKGDSIEISQVPAGAKIFHAGTALRDGTLVTNGGRVFSASASGPTFEEAHRLAYLAAQCVKFEGAFFRSDIGTMSTQ